jgi:hypothetical protein
MLRTEHLKHVACAVGLAILGSPTHAAVSVAVSSEAPPWLWDATLNAGFGFGTNFIAGPTIIDAGALGFAPGDPLAIEVLSGATSAFPPAFPLVDANGNVVAPGADPNAYFGPINDAPGDSGKHFPSRYMPTDWPENLMQLVGTFADASGAIVGSPFAIGSGRIVTVPNGATRLQLGVNDDFFGDNGGSLEVRVALVPEPSTWLMLAAGFGLLAGVSIRRRRGASRLGDSPPGRAGAFAV